MKKYWIVLSALTALGLFNVSTANAEVGVSVNIGQPGFYGQLDIGDYYPRPQLVYAEPRVVFVEPAYRYAQPIYLRVPPGHMKKWSKHCGKYGACGRPVYFVQDNWYQNVYAPRYISYRQHGDDGHRYDHEYWEKHGRHDDSFRGQRDRGHERDYGQGSKHNKHGGKHDRD